VKTSSCIIAASVTAAGLAEVETALRLALLALALGMAIRNTVATLRAPKARQRSKKGTVAQGPAMPPQ
jgi:hypothetical protein